MNINKKTLLIAVAVGGLVGSLVFYITPSIIPSVVKSQHVLDHYNVLLESPPVSGSEAKPITLCKAWDIAWAYAEKWSKDAQLISLASVDAGDPGAEKAAQDSQYLQQLGQDGRRRAWLAVLTSPSLDRQLFLRITDGVVVEATEDGVHDRGIATITKKPAIDSPEAIEQAIDAKSDFRNGVGNNKGYHFVLQTINGESALSVVGSRLVDDVQMPAMITFDPQTGRSTGAQYYTLEKEVPQWKDF